MDTPQVTTRLCAGEREQITQDAKAGIKAAIAILRSTEGSTEWVNAVGEWRRQQVPNHSEK